MKSYGIKRMGGRRAVSQGVAVLRASLHCKVDSTGRRPKYLFSGLLVCGTCGSKYTICEGTKYGCSTWRTRGPSVCANSLTVARGLVEAELLASIQRDLFTEEGLAIFTAEVNRLIAERCRTHTPDRMRAKTELQAAEEEIENIMRAIKAGIFTPSTKAALEEAEAKRSRLLQAVNGSRKPLETTLPNIVGRFKKLVDQLAMVTRQHVDRARAIVQDLVGGQIVLQPTVDGSEHFLTARELCRSDSAGTPVKNNHGGGDPDRTGDPRLMSCIGSLGNRWKPHQYCR
jgi:hypothetical protein